MKIVDGHNCLTASDLSNFLACRHLNRLDVLEARGLIEPELAYDVGFDKLVERGEVHERNVLERFRADGLEIVEIPRGADPDCAQATRDAIRAGASVIYQGVLLHERSGDDPALLGRPDFLVCADVMPNGGGTALQSPRGYEVVDAKLARSAKARAIVQTTFYSHLLANVQDAAPKAMHLALGNGEFVPFRVADYAAYERSIRSLMGSFIAEDPGYCPPTDFYPEPVEHCAICRWSPTCATRRRKDDDLSLIAGMPTSQRLALKAADVSTRRGFAALATMPALGRSNAVSLRRAQLQAQLQVASEDSGTIEYQLLEPDRDTEGALIPNRGLLALPEPSDGDLFFDIEGARYYSEDDREFGLQYLFGIVDTADRDAEGVPRYTQIWAFDRVGEKRAFEELIDFVTVRRGRNPGLHVYHYNHYEPTSIEHLTSMHETREEAVGRLMGRFATHEDEVDDLFRLGVFVDLYRVVRQGVRAGVESYSIKRLEPLVGYQRAVDLRDATKHLIAFDAALEERRASHASAAARVVAGYNEDDCRATLVLRDWLEQRRLELATRLDGDVPRPVMVEAAHGTEDPEVARIKQALLVGIPDDESERTDEQNGKALLADLLEWHRREAKPAWWRFFRLRQLSSAELFHERDAISGLRGGDIVGRDKKSVILRFTFPAQEHGFKRGDRTRDPVTGTTWTIWDLDDEHDTVDFRIGEKSQAALPTDIIESGPIDASMQAARLRELGERVASNGFASMDPATAVLLRRPPLGTGFGDGALRAEGEASVDAALRLVQNLERSCLPIQGPPGTGKTFTAARTILALVAAHRAVGITAPSHAVIHNLLTEIIKQAAESGQVVRIGQRADADNPFLHQSAAGLSYTQLVDGLQHGELDIAAGTVWMWARPEFAATVDTLFVDEAGQLSLANVLSVAGVGQNLVLLGDPQQLAQPSQAAHPAGAGASALEHILGVEATMPDGSGLFLDQTYRMHPALCRYTSEAFYSGRLTGVPGLDQQAVVGHDWNWRDAGLQVVAVNHQGNSNASSEEAAVVADLVHNLLLCQWTDMHGVARPMTAADVLVVTPYNAQIYEIEGAFRQAGISGVGVGSVDKFQGREAPAVIYSMASSSVDDAPRGMEFLFDLHRLNVATSRARGLAIIVMSPDLLRVFCGTPHQMVLANALCLAREE